MGKETISRSTLAKGLTACVITVASLGILQIGEYSLNGSSSASPAAAPGSYTPGTYTASATGISSDVIVTCTFDETSITAIEADVSGETPEIGGVIAEPMIEKVLTAQSPEVDGISGATITSDAFLSAVADCMAQASGQAEAAEVAGTEADASAVSAEAETEQDAATAASAEAETEQDAATAASEAEADTEQNTSAPASEAETDTKQDAAAPASEAETDTEQDASAAESAKAASGTSVAKETEALPANTYAATVRGKNSDITVICTFDGDEIVSIKADLSGETTGIGDSIDSPMIARILEAQSVDVDGVAGATITSDAFKEAVAQCIEQAGASAPVTASAVSFVPGIYTASAQGRAGKVTVAMAMDEFDILSVDIDTSAESTDVGGMIDTIMETRIMDAQSADVDGVSGATITSDAVKAAASDCIAQACQLPE